MDNNELIESTDYCMTDISDFLRSSGDRWNLSESGFAYESQQENQVFGDENGYYDPSQIEIIITNIEVMLNDMTNDFETVKPFHIQIVQEMLNRPSDEVIENLRGLNEKYLESEVILLNMSAELSKIINTYILEPTLVHKHSIVSSKLQSTRILVSLFIKESNIMNERLCLESLCQFAIVKCPFPSLYMKKNQLINEDSVKLQLITSPTLDITSASHINCQDICHSNYNQKTNKVKSIINNNKCILNPNLSSEFQSSFESGSRKDIAQFVFSISLRSSTYDQEIIVTTPPSKPFIVITNECQFGDSLEILFHKDVFEIQWPQTVNEVSWQFYANNLQTYFIKSTRQDPCKPARGLNAYDFIFLNQKFFNNEQIITRQKSEEFWGWFGKVLHKLRYQRHLSTMWNKGSLYGFITREDSNNFLSEQVAGSFIIRFSESSAGSLAISYKENDVKIKNFLFKQENITGSIKSLADFVSEYSEFLYIIEFIGNDPDGRPVVDRFVKDESLKALYSEKKTTKPSNGNKKPSYDELTKPTS